MTLTSDRPCETCGHLGVAHTSRRCIEDVCGCEEYRSHDRDRDHIAYLEGQMREIGEYLLSIRRHVDWELMLPIWGRVSVAAPTLNATDVRRGQEIWRDTRRAG